MSIVVIFVKVFYRTAGVTCLGVALPTVDWVLLHQLITKQVPNRYSHRPIWPTQFFFPFFFFFWLIYSSLMYYILTTVSSSFNTPSLPSPPLSPRSIPPLSPFRKEQAFLEYQLNMAARFSSQLTLGCVELTIRVDWGHIPHMCLLGDEATAGFFSTTPALSVMVLTWKVVGVVSHHCEWAKFSVEAL